MQKKKMNLTEKDRIYYNVWCCAYRRRYDAMMKMDLDLYDREHSTVLMCLKIAKWTVFDSEKKSYPGIL